MPANLTPQYFEAEKAYKAAKTLEEKIAALEEMLAVIPKHKGTDKLQADLKRRLSKLRQSEGKKKGPGGRPNPYKIERGGAGLAAIIGPPNAGKSAILRAVTNAEPEVASYPFTTRVPVPGMMPFENAWVKLVDTPPLSADFRDPDLPGFLRKVDLALLTVDAAAPDLLEGIDAVMRSLEAVKIVLAPEGERGGPGAPVKVKTILAAAKSDLPGAAENVEVLRELYPAFPVLVLSAETGEGLETFRREVFAALDVVRAYTKKPGGKPDFSDPVYLKRGQTVIDFAREIHKDIARNLKYARVWGSAKFDGQMVERDHVVEDGDVIELHA